MCVLIYVIYDICVLYIYKTHTPHKYLYICILSIYIHSIYIYIHTHIKGTTGVKQTQEILLNLKTFQSITSPFEFCFLFCLSK